MDKCILTITVWHDYRVGNRFIRRNNWIDLVKVYDLFSFECRENPTSSLPYRAFFV